MADIRVLIADDQALIRSGFAMILSVEPDIAVVGQASTGAQAVALAASLRPDVVLMDVQMPVMDGIEATAAIVAAGAAKVLILTTFDRDDYLFAGLTAGASGFLLKNADPDELVAAVRTLAQGHALLAPEVTQRVIAAMTGGGAPPPPLPELERLTEREREVLILIGHGRSNSEIAAELFLGEATVKTHVSNCLAKLGVRDRVQAVVLAHRAGLVGR
ncbi:response regulator [Nostocoides sp.]|uniref:response regulator n=1 Tax=Nostocoides sp. TaxID=1917966 RepID=UPI002B6C5BC8|nr:response regulator transcription factor [Tetrasphaera sp.]